MATVSALASEMLQWVKVKEKNT